MYDLARRVRVYTESVSSTQSTRVYSSGSCLAMIDSSFSAARERVVRELQGGHDRSPKGSIDLPIVHLVDFINRNCSDFCTTSSCSGRISVFKEEQSSKGVSWMLVRHGIVSDAEVVHAVTQGRIVNKVVEAGEEAAKKESAIISLKCEPFILHLRCRDLRSGQALHAAALSCGFRESGLTVSNKVAQGKIMLAIRTSAFCQEVPIALETNPNRGGSSDGRGENERSVEWLVSTEYLRLVLSRCNAKLQANFARISRLCWAVQDLVGYPGLWEPPSGCDANPVSDEAVVCRRWGHVCTQVPGWGYLILGGYGVPGVNNARGGSRRGLPALFSNALSQPSAAGGVLSVITVTTSDNGTTTDPSVADGKCPASMVEDCVFAASLDATISTPGDSDLHIVVVTGGRKGPQEPLPAASMLRAYAARVVTDGPPPRDPSATCTAAPAPCGSGSGSGSGDGDQSKMKASKSKNSKKGALSASQLQRKHQAWASTARVTLERLPVEVTGHGPCPRWGHSVVGLGAGVGREGDRGSGGGSEGGELFLLYGGRDLHRTHADCFLGTVRYNQGVLHCHWLELHYASPPEAVATAKPEGGVICPSPGPRFFHAAALLDSSDGDEVRTPSVGVLVHGGLSSCRVKGESACERGSEGGRTEIDGMEELVLLDLSDCVQLERHAHHDSADAQKAPQGGLIQCTPIPVNCKPPKSKDSPCPPLGTQGLFAHRLVGLAMNTYLVSGGVTSLAEPDSESDNDNDDICTEGDDNYEPVANADAPKATNGRKLLHLRKVFAEAAGRLEWRAEASWSGHHMTPPSDDCRCHHQTVLLPAPLSLSAGKREGVASVHEVGGGLHVLAFGQQYCATASMVVSTTGGNGQSGVSTTGGSGIVAARNGGAKTFSGTKAVPSQRREKRAIVPRTQAARRTELEQAPKEQLSGGDGSTPLTHVGRAVDGNELDHLLRKRDSSRTSLSLEHCYCVVVCATAARRVKVFLESIGAYDDGKDSTRKAVDSANREKQKEKEGGASCRGVRKVVGLDYPPLSDALPSTLFSSAPSSPIIQREAEASRLSDTLRCTLPSSPFPFPESGADRAPWGSDEGPPVQFVGLGWLGGGHGEPGQGDASVAALAAAAEEGVRRESCRDYVDPLDAMALKKRQQAQGGPDHPRKGGQKKAAQDTGEGKRDPPSWMLLPVTFEFAYQLLECAQTGSTAAPDDSSDELTGGTGTVLHRLAQTYVAARGPLLGRSHRIELAVRVGSGVLPVVIANPAPSAAPAARKGGGGERNALAYLRSLLPSGGGAEVESALQRGGRGLPSKFELVGDVLMLPEDSLTHTAWARAFAGYTSGEGGVEGASSAHWRALAAAFGPGVKRVARRARVDTGPMRESHVELLLSMHGRDGQSVRPGGGRGAPYEAWQPRRADLSTERALATVGSTAASNNSNSSHNTADTDDEGGPRQAWGEVSIASYLHDYYCLPRMNPGWVVITENACKFGFDLTRVMFCTGNVTERMRMARVAELAWGNEIATTVRIPPLAEQVVVDLYCGVGYYTIPLLLHAGVRHVHALEWNPHSILALRHNLEANGIEEARYTVYHGDNRHTVGSTLKQSTPPLHGVAHRVVLGLLPSSVEGWPLAALCLNKSTGGVLHVHENILQDQVEHWGREVLPAAMTGIFASLPGGAMEVTCVHIERVKSYAPRVLHIVVDLLCVPAR